MVFKETEQKTYEEFKEYILLTLNLYILKEKETFHTIEVLKEIKRRVDNYDKNNIIIL